MNTKLLFERKDGSQVQVEVEQDFTGMVTWADMRERQDNGKVWGPPIDPIDVKPDSVWEGSSQKAVTADG